MDFTLCLLRIVQFFHSRSLTSFPAPMAPLSHPRRGWHQPTNLDSTIPQYSYRVSEATLSFTKTCLINRSFVSGRLDFSILSSSEYGMLARAKDLQRGQRTPDTSHGHDYKKRPLNMLEISSILFVVNLKH